MLSAKWHAQEKLSDFCSLGSEGAMERAASRQGTRLDVFTALAEGKSIDKHMKTMKAKRAARKKREKEYPPRSVQRKQQRLRRRLGHRLEAVVQEGPSVGGGSSDAVASVITVADLIIYCVERDVHFNVDLTMSNNIYTAAISLCDSDSTYAVSGTDPKLAVNWAACMILLTRSDYRDP